MLRILILTKRQYMNKDLIDTRFGRFREIPLALAKMGHTVRGLCLSYAKRREGWTKDGPVSWKSINATPLKLPGLLRFIGEAARLARSADVIWACSDSFYGVIGHLLGRRLGVPVVFDLYDNFEFFAAAKLPIMKQLYRQAILQCDALTCVSRPLAARIAAYGRHNHLHVLENAVREDLFRPLDKHSCRRNLGLPVDAPIVGTAGALHANRGIELLFDAFGNLSNKCPTLHLALAGPRVRTMHIPQDSRVHDLGELPLERVPTFLNALDVAVICNLDNDFGRYCFPQKAREMMACNVPLVAAKVGSMKELLHSKPEWLFDPGSSASLARILEARLANRRTDYEIPPSWSDLGKQLEGIMVAVSERKPPTSWESDLRAPVTTSLGTGKR